MKVLVIGAGPCGLRTAIDVQMMGAQTVIVERRNAFTRNNVLKLWKFLMDDLKVYPRAEVTYQLLFKKAPSWGS